MKRNGVRIIERKGFHASVSILALRLTVETFEIYVESVQT